MTTTKNNEHKKLNFSSEREQSQACLNSAEHEKNQGRKVLNVPNLRFKEFQGEWKRTIFKNVITLQRGSSPRPIIEYVTTSDDGVNWIKIGDMPHFGRIVTSTEEKITKEGAKKSRQVNKGDLILSNSMSYGLPYIMGIDGYIHDGWFVLKNFENTFDKDYLCNLLISSAIQNQYKRLAAGGVVQNISSDLVNSVSVSIPTMMEQKKISSLLNLIDERIATQNKIIDKLQSLIKGLNDLLYTQYGGEVLTSFAELGTSYSGLSGKSAQDFGSGKPFITYLNVYSNNVIKENDFQYVAIKDDEKQNVVKYGDVLFTLSSETPEEVGVGSVYLGKEKVYLNSFCFGIHITNTEVAFPPYLSYYVSLTAFRKFIYPYAQGSTRFNLCKADFEKASIKLPTLADQKRIYSVLGHIDCKIETEKQMLNLYNSQKQYLLRQMFI